jgi:hypothetical protein
MLYYFMIVINKTKYSMGCLILAKIDPQLFFRFSVFTDSMIWKTMNGPFFLKLSVLVYGWITDHLISLSC